MREKIVRIVRFESGYPRHAPGLRRDVHVVSAHACRKETTLPEVAQRKLSTIKISEPSRYGPE